MALEVKAFCFQLQTFGSHFAKYGKRLRYF